MDRRFEQFFEVGLGINNRTGYLSVLHDYIYSIKVNRVLGLKDLYNRDEIGVVQFSENANFSEYPLAINFIIEDAI